MAEPKKDYIKLIATLNKIGIALSAVQDKTRLLEMILSGAMELTNADAGTIYLIYKQTKLRFTIVANNSLNIPSSHIMKTEFPMTSISLYTADNKPNLKNIASYCYHQNKTVNIPDGYNASGFDFSGIRATDIKLNYHSTSFVTIPLRDHQNKILGVMQLINAKDQETNKVISFDEEHIVLAESLASQAAITLTKHDLIQSQKNLFDSLLQLISRAIDEKSTHTSKHCSRVPILTIMIANAMNATNEGPLKDKHFTKEQFDELMISAWLHDCGKIVTPEHVINKATKLEALTDRIEVINARFEILKRDARISYLEKLLVNPQSKATLEAEYNKKIDYLEQAKKYLNKANTGGEFLSDDDKNKIRVLGEENTFSEAGQQKSLLSEQDIMNLSISRGTLNDAEREIIKNHVKLTQDMLESLPYPDYLKNVPVIAGAHHERVDGKGYPHGKDISTIPLQARILAIADIFEALTAQDRPYKTPKPLTEVIKIMNDMKNSGHIDPDLYEIFINEKVYLAYAKQYLKPEQIDLS